MADARPHPPYLVPYACCECRKAFRRPYASGALTTVCPECGGAAHLTSRKFKAPKKSDVAQWEKVRLLLAHGFRFVSIEEGGRRVAYPSTLEEARDFVVRYRKYAKEPADL